MKRLLFTLPLLVMFLFTIQAQESNIFGIKSGYLKIDLSGSTIGTKEIWWDNYGENTCTIEQSTTTFEFGGTKSVDKKNTLSIIKKDKYWDVDYNLDSGTKGTIPGYQMMHSAIESMSDEDRAKVSDNLVQGFGGKKLSPETIGEYDCEVYDIMGVKSWIHKGIVLKVESKMMGLESHEMYSLFEPGKSVSASQFIAPTTIEYVDRTERMNALMAQAQADELDFEEEEEFDINYPFEKYRSITKELSVPSSYHYTTSMNMEGEYCTIYSSGANSSIFIGASSLKSCSDEELEERDSMESVMVNGKTAYFRKGNPSDEEDRAVLIILFPKYEMYVGVSGTEEMSKSELIRISEHLDF